jgi:glucose-6-phosphate 1-dehydrogenase
MTPTPEDFRPGEQKLRAGLLTDKPAEPCAIVIFGATGDLAQRKLFPALIHLTREGALAPQTVMIAVSRRPIQDAAFRQTVLDSAGKFAPESLGDENLSGQFAARIFTCVEDDLAELLRRLCASHGTCGNVLFYLSVPPTGYEAIVRKIGIWELSNTKEGWRRIIVEKPFGWDLASARRLNQTLGEVFREEQIYRIDHYLGKETVQNIVVLRLANALFEPLWNHKYIDHIQITAAESLGVEDRAAYYEEAGAMRDMVQNHMLQVLALIAMEPPSNLNAESIRDEKNKVLAAIRPLTEQDVHTSVVRAQYSAGAMNGKPVPGYLDEHGVNPKSRVETFCALRLWIDNWRWTGVPIYLRTGKRLANRGTEVTVEFKAVPHVVFASSPQNRLEPNILSIRIQPDEGISLKFMAKLPGYALRLAPANMAMRYGESFSGRLSDAYERLLHDAIIGDATLYARRDAVEMGWEFASRILDTWEADLTTPLPQYPAGTWGPQEADQLIATDRRKWRKL